jgi:hypothetical protein
MRSSRNQGERGASHTSLKHPLPPHRLVLRLWSHLFIYHLTLRPDLAFACCLRALCEQCMSGVIWSVALGVDATRSAHRWLLHRWLFPLYSNPLATLCSTRLVISTYIYIDSFFVYTGAQTITQTNVQHVSSASHIGTVAPPGGLYLAYLFLICDGVKISRHRNTDPFFVHTRPQTTTQTKPPHTSIACWSV